MIWVMLPLMGMACVGIAMILIIYLGGPFSRPPLGVVGF